MQDGEATLGRKLYKTNNSSMKNIETLQMNKTGEYTDEASDMSDDNNAKSTRFGHKGNTIQEDDSDCDNNLDELILLDDPEDSGPNQLEEETLTEKATAEE